jgi:outer membrane protein assembly factor BamD (BamD/ComL family)
LQQPVAQTEGPEARPESLQASSLSQQNQVFARGLRARDQGDDRRAAYWFDQLLRRYANSPLAESAERERSAARARLRGN